MSAPTLTIHWFRRDLRLDDNVGLQAALDPTPSHFIPLFILDERLLPSSRAGGARLAFMLACLQSLDAALQARGSRLVVRRGDPSTVLYELMRDTGATRLTYNRDYSPYARQRDRQAVDALRGAGFRVDTFKDSVLLEFNEVLTDKGTLSQIYTPYKKRWLTLPKSVPRPLERPLPPLPPAIEAGEWPSAASLGVALPPEPIAEAGEAAALRRLAAFEAEGLADYHIRRDLLAEEGTSRLSPHLRWGTLSPRRCFAAAERVGGEGAEVWISELAWRDFYQATLAHHPRVLTASFRPEYDNIRWENRVDWFEAWQAGRTGFPIVDAAMRQLKATGWMHNRARMLVASFLCKDLLIDWRWGERYFMQQLLDGDSAANNGGWQWAAGTGNDAAPYFRIFNPISQAAKFDPTGAYQRRWLPELGTPAYPAPLVDHAQQRERALAMYSVVQKAKKR